MQSTTMNTRMVRLPSFFDGEGVSAEDLVGE